MIKYLKLTFLLLQICLFATAFATPSQKLSTIAYTEAGKGAPLVLIHAFPTDKRLWSPQLHGLKSYFRIIAVDLTGFGDSEDTDGKTVSMETYADDVKQLLDERGIKKAIIGGESMGGWVAMSFFKKYPDRVAGLILSGTDSIAATPEEKKEHEDAAVDVLQNGSAKLIADFLPLAVSPFASKETRAYLKTIFESQTVNGIASGLRGIATREDTSNVLRNTRLPVLIITGDQDEVIAPKESVNMHAIAKNSRLLIIKNSGHLVNLEKPQAWNQAVVEMFYR